MQNTRKKVLFVLAAGFLIMAGIYGLVMRGIIQINLIPGARTLYRGEVGIEKMAMEEIKMRLQKQCSDREAQTDEQERRGKCFYAGTQVANYQGEAIEVYPNGLGWGPISFTVTEEKVAAGKDIEGSPNPEKFKQELRQEIEDLGNFVIIKEKTWKILEMKYPWK